MPGKKTRTERTSEVSTVRLWRADVRNIGSINRAYYAVVGKRQTPNKSDVIRWALAYAAEAARDGCPRLAEIMNPYPTESEDDNGRSATPGHTTDSSLDTTGPELDGQQSGLPEPSASV